MNVPVPTTLKLIDPRTLQIDWSDGQCRRYAVQELRDQCPCAGCREKRTHGAAQPNPLQLTILSAAEARPLRVESMKPVGNYAYSIAFSDGHDTGIYTLEFLRELGAAVPTTGTP
ncbi:MAG: DUF971 domain-containing protein [Pirellulaceae bacterium]|jgi:DUF971 family protein|nr:DUF971 domain-containing protein [Pirellulaceae bacterium]